MKQRCFFSAAVVAQGVAQKIPLKTAQKITRRIQVKKQDKSVHIAVVASFWISSVIVTALVSVLMPQTFRVSLASAFPAAAVIFIVLYAFCTATGRINKWGKMRLLRGKGDYKYVKENGKGRLESTEGEANVGRIDLLLASIMASLACAGVPFVFLLSDKIKMYSAAIAVIPPMITGVVAFVRNIREAREMTVSEMNAKEAEERERREQEAREELGRWK